MLNAMGMGFTFFARDLASGTINKIGKSLKDLDGVAEGVANRGLSSLKMGLGLAAAGAVGLGVAFKAARSFSDFEFKLTGVGAVMRATAQEMDLLKNAAIEAGIKTEFSPTQAVEGLQALGQAGQSATQATKSLIPVLDLAGASFGQVGVGGAAKAVVGVLNSYGFSADKASEVTDKLVRITQMSNFQIRDFEGGLSTAASSAGVFGQSMDDTLVLMGLLRNKNIDASSSATALRESFRRLGSDKSAQKHIEGLVDIFDKQTGKMRPVLDITEDLIDKTKNMTDQQRNAIVVQGFGARGLNAFAAIEKATYTERKNGIDVTLKGRDAIEAMRKSLENAGGTAQEFRSKMLDTFAGQQILLGGSMSALGIAAGEGFTAAFKPLVSGAITVVNMLTEAILAVPAPVKAFFAQLFIAASVIATLVGFALLAKGALLVMGVTFGGVASAVGTALIAILPIIAVLGVLIGIGYALKKSFDENIGGFRDMVVGAFEKIQLVYQGLVQVFTDGGFSGAVRDDLNRADNAGLKVFIKEVFGFVARIRNFFRGIKTGIDESIGGAAPVFEGLKNAVVRLLEAFGLMDAGIDHAAAKGSFSAWGRAGQIGGRLIIDTLEAVANIVTFVIDTISYLKNGWDELTSGVDVSQGAFSDILETGKELLTTLGLMGDSGGDVGGVLKDLAGVLMSVFVGALESAMAAVDSILIVLRSVFIIIEGISNLVGGVLTGNWEKAWLGMKQIAFGAITGIVNLVMGLVRTLGGVLDALGRLGGVDLGMAKAASDLRKVQLENLGEARGWGLPTPPAANSTPAPPGQMTPASPLTSPAVAAAAGGAQNAAQGAAATSAAASQIAASLPPANSSQQPQVIQATMVVDGTALGKIVARVDRSNANRSGVPVSVAE